MPFLPFHADMRVYELTESGLQVGSYTITENLELNSIRIHIFKHLINSDAQIRLRLSTTESMANSFSSTDWVTVSDFDDASDYWLGFVNFNITESASLKGPATYYLYAELSNYNYASGAYLATVLDDDRTTVNDSTGGDSYGAACEFVKFGVVS